MHDQALNRFLSRRESNNAKSVLGYGSALTAEAPRGAGTLDDSRCRSIRFIPANDFLCRARHAGSDIGHIASHLRSVGINAVVFIKGSGKTNRQLKFAETWNREIDAGLPLAGMTGTCESGKTRSSKSDPANAPRAQAANEYPARFRQLFSFSAALFPPHTRPGRPAGDGGIRKSDPFPESRHDCADAGNRSP